MDFIKTSSLRALSELTFQRNWNGLIEKTGPDGSIEKPRPSRAEQPAEERMFRVGQSLNRPSKLGQVHVSTRESNVPRSAKSQPRSRARPCRASREATPRGRATSHVPRPMRHPIRKAAPRPARNIGQIFTRRPAADHESPATTVPICR
ncbi:unnamed protein product [Microthlaspi erraticum]|uniref:Uncharacterized protein n=1 Tax=Microthlaspi erraticum TaxID=1685480 RepID=A0A6D2JYK3_9BRAS|nr:unnamed protein product [Microthlaspi erraticum]